jgi:large subunit ribosomal protein L22
MEITAKLRHLKITARKVRLVADLVRNKSVNEAEAILRFTPKKACLPMLKLLRSAEATVKNTYKLDPADFYVAKLLVNDGPMSDRVFPRSRGRADKIQKKTSHITMVLDKKRGEEKKEVATIAPAKKAAKKVTNK